MKRSTPTRVDDAEDKAISRIVDALLAEHGIPVDDADQAPARLDRAERPRGSWMDQVGRARR